MDKRSPAVSPRVVAHIFIIQKNAVICGSLLIIAIGLSYFGGFTIEDKCQELGKIERNLKKLVKFWLDAAFYRVYVEF